MLEPIELVISSDSSTLQEVTQLLPNSKPRDRPPEETFKSSFAEYGSIVAIFADLVALYEFADKLFPLIKFNKGKQIHVKSPLGKVTLTYTQDLSKEDVREKIKKIAALL